MDTHNPIKKYANQEALARQTPVGAGGGSSLLDSSNTQGENKPKLVYWKLIKTGHYEEYYKYSNPILLNPKSKTTKPNSPPPELTEEEQKKRRAKYQKSSVIRTFNNVRRLVDANFTANDKFITLTFEDTDRLDIKQVQPCNAELHKFIKRLKYRYKQLKYLAAIEFQDRNSRGAVHYHLICKLPFVSNEQLAAIWGFGFTWIENIDKTDSIGGYITKYLVKNSEDPRLFNQKRFFTSRNLIRPQTTYGAKVQRKISQHAQSGSKPIYRNIYKSDYYGKVDYYQFDLNRLEGKHDN